ncbi:penicillin-binding protein [Candidatus Shapirobacteria bacterium CG09_land_8_20_14_0_10_47_13]|uniref:Penicillin-binding protein n=1 Tax=Candidatus Shapirobacteria bacterium CG09_land_8_20_14_0_10_47_13 TaxID=1974481 RepID=A0A2H0WMF0_9BACT|nr:MAG: penicillin-binding protein [Candidatus Shapirobacteria bacterium CG09_land_8_20_14_0_10_47_13]
MSKRRTRKPSAPLSRFLELLGKPIYWLILAVLSAGLKLRLPKAKLPRISLPKIKVRRPKISFKFPQIKISRQQFLILILVCLSLVAIPYTLYAIFANLPSPDRLVTRDQIVSTKIYDRNGELLYKIYRNQNRTLVALKDLPLFLTQATIAIEDAEFYQHHGFSAKGILRAFLRNLNGDKLYGGSTITQQLVKNALLTPERTWQRKFKEIILALLVEAKFSKDQILQMYLNEVAYGGTAYGVEEAAQTYFGKSAAKLDLAEAALLAGLPASPTNFSPFGAHPEAAKERQQVVLRRMQQEKFISEKEEQAAADEELQFAPQRTDIKAPHFVMYIKDLLAQQYGEAMVEGGGLEVTTSLDLKTQEATEKIVAEEIQKIKGLRIGNSAALVTRPATGEILAMVGSANYFDLPNDGNVNVTLRPRQPGSSIKPVNYSIALENGFTAATLLSDTPITYQVAGQPPYSPRNYDGRFHGQVPLRIALASSYNVPAVKVLSAFGVDRMIKRGQDMGITTWDDPSRFGLSLTLGGGEVKMIDMAVVYGTLANLGNRVSLVPILEVKNYKGKVLEKLEISNSQRVLPADVAWLLTNILSDNNARTPAFGPRSLLNIVDHPHVAVKTGTTQNLRDNWTLGYTPDFVVSVWVGNNDNTPMSWVASGITGASPIWNRIMTTLIKDRPDVEFPRPESLKRLTVCGREDWFISGTESKVSCPPAPTPTPTP